MYNGASNITIVSIDGYSGAASYGLKLLKHGINVSIYRKLEGGIWSYIINVGGNTSGLMEIISSNEVNNVSVNETAEDTSSWEAVTIQSVN